MTLDITILPVETLFFLCIKFRCCLHKAVNPHVITSILPTPNSVQRGISKYHQLLHLLTSSGCLGDMAPQDSERCGHWD